MGRLTMWKAAIALSKDHPMLGVGFGGRNWMQEGSRYVTDQEVGEMIFVHNNYLQILADTGYPALFTFLLLLFGSIAWLETIIWRHKPYYDDVYHCASALQLALIAFAVGSMFLSRENYDFIYILLMVVASLWNAVAAMRDSRSEVVAVATPSGGASVAPAPQAEIRDGVPDWAAPGAGRRLRMQRTSTERQDNS